MTYDFNLGWLLNLVCYLPLIGALLTMFFIKKENSAAVKWFATCRKPLTRLHLSHGSLPAGEERLASICRHIGLEAFIKFPDGTDVLNRVDQSGSARSEVGGSQHG